MERGSFDLNGVVREVLDLTRRQAERSDVAVIVTLGELPLLTGDASNATSWTSLRVSVPT